MGMGGKRHKSRKEKRIDKRLKRLHDVLPDDEEEEDVTVRPSSEAHAQALGGSDADEESVSEDLEGDEVEVEEGSVGDEGSEEEGPSEGEEASEGSEDEEDGEGEDDDDDDEDEDGEGDDKAGGGAYGAWRG
jgi:hypothetical protein